MRLPALCLLKLLAGRFSADYHVSCSLFFVSFHLMSMNMHPNRVLLPSSACAQGVVWLAVFLRSTLSLNCICTSIHRNVFRLWPEFFFCPILQSNQSIRRWKTVIKQRERKKMLSLSAQGPSIKDVGMFLAVFDTPLPHVGISTLIYLTSTL